MSEDGPLDASPSRASVTLSIVSHGHGDLLRALLRDIAALPSLASAEVIVTLNLADEPFDAAEWAPMRISVIRNPTPRGFGTNHNQAFQNCDSTWFLVLNPDLRLPEDPLPALLASGERHTDVALWAPRVVSTGGCLEDSVRANLSPLSLLARSLLRRRSPLSPTAPALPGQQFYWLAGMFLLLRSEPFREVGGFDERYFLYCEDYDLCARLFAAGHGLGFEPAARVVHDARRSSHRSFKYLSWHLRSLARVWTSKPYWRVTLDPIISPPLTSR